MDSDRWQRIKSIYQKALDLPAGERAVFVREAAGEDDALSDEILALLDAPTDDDAIEGIVDQAAREAEQIDVKGRRIGPYRVLDILGQGGMGQVFLAERADDEFEQRVAIKMASWLNASPELIERFRLERQILARLEHPGIARILDGGRTDSGIPYFVMEYVDGTSIDRYCDAGGLSVRERLKLFSRVCDAVDYAHRRLIVHRDLKPGNILVDGLGEPRLLDFGIAKILEDGAYERAVTRTGSRVMTPEYASPEQVRGEPASVATDVYALGVLLYRLISGHSPYGDVATTPGSIERAIVETDPKRPSTVVTEATATEASAAAIAAIGATTPAKLQRLLSGDLDNIVLKALQKEPERRYASARQLKEDIENYLADRPVAARADSLGYVAGKFLRRNRWSVAAAGTFVATIVAMTVFYTAQLANERNTARLEAERATEIADFLTDLFAEADPRRNLGEPLSARQMLDRGAGRIAAELVGQPELQAALMVTIGRSYQEMRENRVSRDYLTAALETAETTLGETHPNTVELRHLLALARTHVGEPATAEALFAKNLAIQRDRHGPGSLEVAREIKQLALVDDQLGRYAEAEARFREALAMSRRLGEPGQDLLVSTLLDYGAMLRRLDREPEEEPILLEALAIRERQHGREHPDYAAVLNNLGNHYFRRGALARASQYMQEHVALQRRFAGEDGVAYGNALANYSALVLAEGRDEEALALLDEAIVIFGKGYGTDSVPYAFITENKANILKDLKRYADADPLYRRTLEIIADRLGRDHSDYAFTLSNYGGMLVDAGRYPEAERTLRDAVATFTGAHGPGYSRTMLAEVKLAQALEPQDKLDDALAVATNAVATARQAFPEPHMKLVNAIRVLAIVHRERREYGEADTLFREAIALAEQVEQQPLIHAHEIELQYAGSLAAQARFADARAMLSARATQFAELGDAYADARRAIEAALQDFDRRTTD